MKLYLDDVRPTPEGFDLRAYTANDAINLLDSDLPITHISFDHDLGPEEAGTGYDVAKYLEQMAYEGAHWPLTWEVHSANPVGRKNIEAAMTKAEQYWRGKK